MSNRADFALNLLKEMGTVTNGYISDNYRERVFCWRNSVAEAKKFLAPGWVIVANIKGREWRNHSYTLKQVPIEQKQLELVSNA